MKPGGSPDALLKATLRATHGKQAGEPPSPAPHFAKIKESENEVSTTSITGEADVSADNKKELKGVKIEDLEDNSIEDDKIKKISLSPRNFSLIPEYLSKSPKWKKL